MKALAHGTKVTVFRRGYREEKIEVATVVSGETRIVIEGKRQFEGQPSAGDRFYGIGQNSDLFLEVYKPGDELEVLANLQRDAERKQIEHDARQAKIQERRDAAAARKAAAWERNEANWNARIDQTIGNDSITIVAITRDDGRVENYIFSWKEHEEYDFNVADSAMEKYIAIYASTFNVTSGGAGTANQARTREEVFRNYIG